MSAVWDLFDKMSTGDIPEEWAERYEVVLQNDRRILEALLPDRNNEEPRTGSLALLATDFWAVSMDPMEFFEVIQIASFVVWHEHAMHVRGIIVQWLNEILDDDAPDDTQHDPIEEWRKLRPMLFSHFGKPQELEGLV